MSEKTRTVDVKFSLTVTVQQLDLPGIDPWVVNGKPCKDKAAAMKEIASLMNDVWSAIGVGLTYQKIDPHACSIAAQGQGTLEKQ